MLTTKDNRPARPFFSLKWRALLIFSLLLLGINSVSVLYFSRHLLNQFEQERKAGYTKQVSEIEGMLRQASATQLAMADVIPLVSGVRERLQAGDVGGVAREFDRHWESVQLSSNVDFAQLYTIRSELVRTWDIGEDGLLDTALFNSYVREVNRTEQPVTFLDCTARCMQFAVSPMLAKDRNSGVIVMGSTLAAAIVSYRNITGVDIGILNVVNGERGANDESRNIASWHLRVSALTNLEQNLPMLRSAEAAGASVAALAAGIRQSYHGREFEVHLVPIEKYAAGRNTYFILIDDITERASQVRAGIIQNVTMGVASLVLSEIILLLILWRPLSHLRRTAAALPLLAKNAFEDIRRSVRGTQHGGRYRDEVDMLDETLISVSHQLETLQKEVAQRTVELIQANSRLGTLNEELDRKVKERTQQLLDAQGELVRKEKLAVLGQVAGSVGHELRNPLGVMSNAVYFLQAVLSDADDSVKEYLGIIKNEIASSERIVSDLLDSVRTKPPHPQSVAVAELVGQTLGKITLPTSVTVRQDIPLELPPLKVDAMQIQQVLRNLMSNGVEAMPDGGVLEIRATPDPVTRTITIVVKDSGIGMTPEQLAKLFQPLYTTKARGIGLGLVVVKNLITANGGRVEVLSEVGKGTTFTVTLPGDFPVTEP